MGKMLFAWLLAAVLAGCGGGGGGGTSTDPGVAPPAPSGASLASRTLKSTLSGTTYDLDIYLPPADLGPRSAMATVYVLDGESRFNAVTAIAEAERLPLIVVGIHGEGMRAVDYVPTNTCTGSGGGHVAYLAFLREQLAPFIESGFGGDPAKRILLGHSHGGSFVYYALFAEAPAAHTFHAYLASDASIWCMPDATAEWEASYAAAHTSLPVRLHVSHAGAADNPLFAGRILARNYTGLALREQGYPGGHLGIIPLAFRDALLFALGR